MSRHPALRARSGESGRTIDRCRHSERLLHQRAVEHDTIFESDWRLADRSISCGLIDSACAVHSDELEVPEAFRRRTLFRILEKAPADAAPRAPRTHEHRPDARRLCGWIDQSALVACSRAS